LGVLVGSGDGFLENRGVGGDALQAVVVDQGLQAAVLDQTALQIVEPDRLTAGFELSERCHTPCPFAVINRALAASNTASAVKPNRAIRSSAGAEAPKLLMPIRAPADPT